MWIYADAGSPARGLEYALFLLALVFVKFYLADSPFHPIGNLPGILIGLRVKKFSSEWLSPVEDSGGFFNPYVTFIVVNALFVFVHYVRGYPPLSTISVFGVDFYLSVARD